jgi:hypothetical protein
MSMADFVSRALLLCVCHHIEIDFVKEERIMKGKQAKIAVSIIIFIVVVKMVCDDIFSLSLFQFSRCVECSSIYERASAL